MRAYSLTHLSDGELLCALASLVARERTTTAELIAHIAEVDARKLYAPAGYSSMHEYCVGELRLSEDAASKRLHVARKVRDFPALLTALADGRIHLTGACLLAPHLSPGNVDDLLKAATHKTILPVQSQPIVEHAPAHAEGAAGAGANPNAPEPGRAPFPKLTPLAPERFALQVTISKNTHDKLHRAQDLLSHALPSGDLAQVLDRALDALIEKVAKRKFGATSQPRQTQPRSTYGAGFMHEKREAARLEKMEAQGMGSCAVPAALRYLAPRPRVAH
jgi:hypothetical protein